MGVLLGVFAGAVVSVAFAAVFGAFEGGHGGVGGGGAEVGSFAECEQRLGTRPHQVAPSAGWGWEMVQSRCQEAISPLQSSPGWGV
ncbi:hypothetical protein AB0D42_37495 [Streptomyces sp. NPDC048304]|uniref:hypothetical protein n=1 Tax=Streptomyces sp. NPDC048304 TaxID=3154820 RepID=UPI0033C9776D